MRSPMLSSGYNIRVFWRCELLLRPISRTGILFIPMTPLQQTIKTRMCNREITAVGFNNLSQCRLCEFWLWLLQHCKWRLNACCHFFRGAFYVLSHCCIQNRVSWKQNSDTDELRTVVDNRFRYYFLDNHNCNSSLFVTAITLTHCFSSRHQQYVSEQVNDLVGISCHIHPHLFLFLFLSVLLCRDLSATSLLVTAEND